MLLQKLIVSFGFLALVSAQGATFPVPSACTPLCPVLQQFLDVTAATLPPLCTEDVQNEVIACFACIETNAPTELTSAELDVAQTAFNGLQTSCGSIGSPLPSASIPGATGTTSIGIATTLPTGAATGASSTTPTGGAASTSSVNPSTTSRSGAMVTTQRNLGVAVVAVAFTVVMYAM